MTESYEYDPYGAPAPNGSGQWAAGSTDVATDQFGFAAGYRPVGGLYHFGQRYYDPAAMRWTQPDPLDQTGDLREGNKYLYAGGEPVGLVDPTGMKGQQTSCSVGPVSTGWGRNSTGHSYGRLNTDRNAGGGFGAGGGCASTNYTGEADGHKVTVGAEVCAVACLGVNSDTGVSYGLGFKVSAGVDINFDIGDLF